jgi:hypothetical protein
VAETEVRVATTPHDDRVLVECSECGPVAVSNYAIEVAAMMHLGPIHGYTELRQVEKP